ncbi:MAG: adaptor protein MecA [Oscillospiraceae bacterium]
MIFEKLNNKKYIIYLFKEDIVNLKINCNKLNFLDIYTKNIIILLSDKLNLKFNNIDKNQKKLCTKNFLYCSNSTNVHFDFFKKFSVNCEKNKKSKLYIIKCTDINKIFIFSKVLYEKLGNIKSDLYKANNIYYITIKLKDDKNLLINHICNEFFMTLFKKDTFKLYLKKYGDHLIFNNALYFLSK